MAGTAAGAAKARARASLKAKAKGAARRAAYLAETAALEQASTVVSESIKPDGALMPAVPADALAVSDNPQQFGNSLLTKAIPLAAVTVINAMTQAPWQQALAAAIRVLEIGGIAPKDGGAGPDEADMDDGELALFMSAGAQALALRRSAETAEDAEVVSPDPVPSPGG